MADDNLRAHALRGAREEFGDDHPITQAALHARRLELLADEAERPKPGLWWTSFADDDGFLGVAVVEAIGSVHAVQRHWELGINPGGEALTFGPFPAEWVPDRWRDRLLTRVEAEQLDQEAADG